MKKAVCTLLVCLLFTAGLGSCEKTTVAPIDCGKDVVSLMAEMTANEQWMSLHDIHEIHDELATTLRAGDYTEISAVYELTIPEDSILPLLSDYTSIIESLPDNLREYLRDSIYISFASRINASEGSTALAISSLYSAQMVFGNCPDTGNTVYLYVFENGYPIAVTITEGEGGAVRANGSFILNDSLNTENAESIEETIKKLALHDVKVTKK